MSATPYDEEDLQEWPPETAPVVFRSPPDVYEVITPNRFQEWESTLQELTGLTVKDAKDEAGDVTWTRHLPTISWCGPGKTDACDCDML
jgi:hypothetical protein